MRKSKSVMLLYTGVCYSFHITAWTGSNQNRNSSGQLSMKTSTFKTELKFYKQKLHRSTQRITSLNPHIKQQKHQQHEAGGTACQKWPKTDSNPSSCSSLSEYWLFAQHSEPNGYPTPCLLSLGQLHPSTQTYWKVYWLHFASSRLNLFSELP